MTKEKIKYGEAIQELEEILQKIQDGDVDVDDLAKKTKKAIELIKICKSKIEKTEIEIKKVVESFGQNKTPEDNKAESNKK